MSFLRSESYKKGAVSSTIFNIAAKGLGFINSLLIIHLFGSGFKTDLYFVILSTVIVVTSFINSIDPLVLIPESMRLRINSGELAEKRFLNFFVLTYAGVGLLIALIVLCLPVFYYSLFTKYDHQLLQGERLMLVASALLFPLQLVVNLFISILGSYKYFTVPMMVGLVNSVISITILLLVRDYFSTLGAVVALLAGNLINFIWLSWYLKKQLNWKFFERSPVPSKKVISNILLMQVNILPISVRTFATTLLLSGLGAGVITSLNYGQQLAFIPELLIVTQIMAIIAVKFNELSARDEKEELNRFFSDLLKLLYLVILPAGAIMALTSREIVDVIFSFTSKLDNSAKENIALVVFFLALTLPARGLDLALTRLIMARQKVKQGVVYAILVHLVITILVITGIKIWGLKGYLLAIFAGYNFFLPLIYYVLLKKIAPFIKYLTWIRESMPFFLFNIALICLLYFVKQWFFSGLHPLMNIFLVGGIYATLVLIFNYFVPHYIPLNNQIKKILLRK